MNVFINKVEQESGSIVIQYIILYMYYAQY